MHAGVHASADGADVATPVSLVEWFLNFYEAAQHGRVRPLEGIVRAGEVLFVPRGWWHLAINLEVRAGGFHPCPEDCLRETDRGLRGLESGLEPTTHWCIQKEKAA